MSGLQNECEYRGRGALCQMNLLPTTPGSPVPSLYQDVLCSCVGDRPLSDWIVNRISGSVFSSSIGLRGALSFYRSEVRLLPIGRTQEETFFAGGVLQHKRVRDVHRRRKGGPDE